MKHPIEHENGFTLVELMVVVAIIGLLSSVAVPNFKKYQAKAKIAEAKMQLSALYTAEQSFFSDYDMYHWCLPYMGFDPGPEAANRYYAVGFNASTQINLTAYTSAINSGLDSNSCPRTVGAYGAVGGNSPSNAILFFPGKGIGSSLANTDNYVDATPTFRVGNQVSSAAMTFTAVAAGVISAEYPDANGYGPKPASLLSIDQNKVLRNIINGY